MNAYKTATRRGCVKVAAMLALAFALQISLALGREVDPPRTPNILLILADDLGWGHVGYQSEGRFLTPNIDLLAREGVVFSNGYACAANCSPSRTCLLQGAYTPRTGVYFMEAGDRGARNQQRLIPVLENDRASRTKGTLVDTLNAAGYATGLFGKWDGFGLKKSSLDALYVTKNDVGPLDDPKYVYTLTDKAVEFMAANRTRPFFCFLAHRAPHSPVEVRPETLERVAERSKAAGVKEQYMGCVNELDDSIGRLLAKLRELGLEENTLVVFTSDNGAGFQHQPLRGCKGNYYEGGVREPFVIRWPGRSKAGAICDVPVAQLDLYPTFLDAAGISAPAGVPLDGASLLPALQEPDRGLDRAPLFWHFPCYMEGKYHATCRDPFMHTRPVSVIRKGDWKLFLYHEEWQLDGGRDKLATNNAVELYNIKEDIGERENRAADNTSKRDELLDDLLKWLEGIDAPMPCEKNPAYAPDA